MYMKLLYHDDDAFESKSYKEKTNYRIPFNKYKKCTKYLSFEELKCQI